MSELFKNDYAMIDTTPAFRADGQEYEHLRITSGKGLGGIAIPTVNLRGINYLAMVKQYRPVLDEETLEFPRGGTDSLDAAEAIRELVEETSLEPLKKLAPLRLGIIYPDTGILTTKVSVWQIAINPHSVKLAEGYIENESNAEHKWLSEGEIRGAVKNGKIRCSMTLAAFALWNAWIWALKQLLNLKI